MGENNILCVITQSFKNIYLVKCYDKSNMNIFTLSLWDVFWWGLIYFGQFSYFYKDIMFVLELPYLFGHK